MDIQAWGILTSLLFVSLRANHYDKHSPKFYLTASSPKLQNYEAKQVVIYLTPRQIKAFKSNGAVVKFQSDAESDFSFEVQQQTIEERTENNQEGEENKLSQHSESENIEEQNQDLEVAEIIITTNGEKEDNGQNITEALSKAQVGEKYIVQPRDVFSQFKNKSGLQRQEKYVASALAQKKQPNYSYPPNQQVQRVKEQRFLPPQQEFIESKEEKVELQTETPVKQNIFNLIPSAMASKSEEWAQEGKQKQELKEHAEELNTVFLNHEQLVKSIGQDIYKLVENEFQFQSMLRNLKASPNYIDRKYVAQIEKRRTNLEQQNNNPGAIVIPPFVLIKEEIITKHPEELPVSTPFVIRVPEPFEVNVPQGPTATMSSVSAPVVEETELENKTDKPMSDTKNIYFKVTKPYFEEIQKDTDVQKPDQLPIL